MKGMGEVVKSNMKGVAHAGALEGRAGGEEECGEYVLTKVCLELLWDSSQDEWLQNGVCVCVFVCEDMTNTRAKTRTTKN